MKSREAYRAPDSLPGTTTYRDEGSEKGLPPDKGDGGGHQDPDSASRRERALPAPSDDGGAVSERSRSGPPVFNVPGPSDSHPDGSLHKDRVRTKSVPGDQYDPEPISQPGGGFRRRTLQGVEAGKKKPFPTNKQRKQKGKAYLYSRRWYKKNRKKKIMTVKRKYRVERNKGWKKRDTKNRNDPSKDKRFQRKPGGGYKDPSDRTKDWRGGDKRTKLKVKRKNAAFDEGILHRTPPRASTVEAELELMLELQEDLRGDFMDFILWLEDVGPAEVFLAELEDLGLEMPLDEVYEIAEGAGAVARTLKAEFARPRPVDTALEYGIPLEAVGEHPSWSYPSIHVLQAELLARYLSHIHPEYGDLFRSLADDVARSRVVGGMHFPSDCEYAIDLADEMEGDMIQEWGYSDDAAGRVARQADFFRDQEWNPQRSDDSREPSSVPEGDDVPSQSPSGLTTWIGQQEEREDGTPAHGYPVDRDRPGAPGSAKVIPRGQGFSGRTAAPKPPYPDRDDKLIDSTSRHALWETKYGSKKYWLITDHGGRMVDEHGGGFGKKRDAMSAWSEYKGRTAANTFKPGDWFIDPNARGIGGHRAQVVLKIDGTEIIYRGARGLDARVDVSEAIPVTPTYDDLLGYTGMKAAEGIKWRMETKGETFEEAARRMTSLRGWDAEALKTMKEYILKPDRRKLRRRAGMDGGQRELLQERWESVSDAGLRKLRKKLLAVGGDEVVPLSEPDLQLLLSRGREMKGRVKMMKGSPSKCHQNVANMVDDGFEMSPATGWVLDDDLWRQHSWGVLEDGTIIETTQKRDRYWGVILEGEEASEFCELNRYASKRQLVAAKLAEIMGGTAQKVQQRADTLSVKMTRVLPKSAMWLFNVSGGENTHRVRLKAVRKGNVRTLDKADILVSCDCDFWRWQGPEHWAKAGGYLYGRPRGSASSPTVRDPNGEHRACKHVVAVLRKAKGYSFRTRNQDKKMRELRRNKTASPWDVLVSILIPSPGRVAERHGRRDADL